MLKKSSWLTNEFRNDDFYTASIDKEFLVIKFKIIGLQSDGFSNEIISYFNLL